MQMFDIEIVTDQMAVVEAKNSRFFDSSLALNERNANLSHFRPFQPASRISQHFVISVKFQI